jgi:signal transduction histidine kinase/ActR/RegA family two-component response regulator
MAFLSGKFDNAWSNDLHFHPELFAMWEFLSNLFNTSGFPPRWNCGTWTAGHGWLHIVSDTAVFGAYTAIPVVLAFFVIRKRDVPFPKIFWLFAAFIFACGFGHLIEAIIFWQPVYRFAGVVKFGTALVSWATVLALIPIVPQALNLPGLAKLNEELRGEVEERRRMEEALRRSEEKLAELLASEREARSEAERANRVKDEFISTVSHELRTPLHAILGYAQLLLRDQVTKDQSDGLSVIERNAKVQAQIIDDLLDMSRIMSGKVRLDAKTIDMVQVVEAAVATVQPAADAKGIRIQSMLDPKAGPALGDSGRLQQVVWNLLTNAIKFTPKGGRIQVVMERVNSHLELRVSDTGQGIKPEFLNQVFDRFRQADSATTRRQGGLGLGLSIVKHLVELHGGQVAAFSPGEDQGATFVVTLPVQIIHRDGDGWAGTGLEDRLNKHQLSPQLSGLRVLVVDDEPDARELIRRLLAEHCAESILAASADEALRLMREKMPDIVLSDIGMPDKDGYDLIRSVRSLPAIEGGNIPAAALTAMARAEDRTHAMLAGFQAHITKPVDPTELIAVVATLTGRTGRPVSPLED